MSYQILNDESPMPWGKYKGIEMANVPADYLLWLYDNGNCNGGVKDYIRDNLKGLRQEVLNDK
jgi:uncharacterized protein (DUF3820 family)